MSILITSPFPYLATLIWYYPIIIIPTCPCQYKQHCEWWWDERNPCDDLPNWEKNQYWTVYIDSNKELYLQKGDKEMDQ